MRARWSSSFNGRGLRLTRDSSLTLDMSDFGHIGGHLSSARDLQSLQIIGQKNEARRGSEGKVRQRVMSSVPVTSPIDNQLTN